MFEVRWRCPMPSLDGAVEPAERLDCHPGRRRSSSSVGRSARSAGVMSQGVTAEFTIVRVRVRCYRARSPRQGRDIRLDHTYVSRGTRVQRPLLHSTRGRFA